jgi:hypothetical protein
MTFQWEAPVVTSAVFGHTLLFAVIRSYTITLKKNF